MTAARHFRRPDGAVIAYERTEAQGASKPGIVFLHGLRSDRGGTKAEALAARARAAGRAFLRFDMFGHGESGGRFQDGGISRWVEDAVAVLDELTEGPQILIGSSMGAWVMVKAALARPGRIAGLVGIAAAPDFTEDLMWERFDAGRRRALLADGVVELPSAYGDGPYPISRHLIEDGRQNLVLRAPIAISCPVRLIHGQRDTDVPWATSLRLAERIAAGDVHTHLVKDGDHRLSRPCDLALLCGVVDGMTSEGCV